MSQLAWPSTDLDVDSVGRDEPSDAFDQPRLQSSRLEPRDTSSAVCEPNQSSEFLFAQTLH